ncbi:unnamed protein product [Phytophthora lilii]|uniref:Unnamed protein product n=1 Tax=Phytophthora lilii TaxID=2077276 RepID=A0A9W6UCE8_9STRA|nr:unnamed protein product [Phytophthora lilii]
MKAFKGTPVSAGRQEVPPPKQLGVCLALLRHRGADRRSTSAVRIELPSSRLSGPDGSAAASLVWSALQERRFRASTDSRRSATAKTRYVKVKPRPTRTPKTRASFDDALRLAGAEQVCRGAAHRSSSLCAARWLVAALTGLASFTSAASAHSAFHQATRSPTSIHCSLLTMVKILRSAFAVASLALSMSAVNVVRGEELCSIAPSSYATAKTNYPDLAFALSAVEKYSIAAWYTDRLSKADRATMLDNITSKCSEGSRMTIVVYGIPNKDCNAGYSSGGTVSNTADYKTFLSDLTAAVGNRKVLYIVGPDAVGLLAEDGGCGSSAGYLDNLKVAVEALSANANAELYVDVGYWTLMYDSQRSKVVTVIKDLAKSGTLKGITINTSNYRSTDQVAELCTNFQTAMGSTDMTCVIDTSRNYVAPTTTDWCNVMGAGIGYPPTSETNITNLDYFMWIKPPGESDGTCSDGSLGMNTIAEGGTDTTSSQTSSQTTSSASQTTESSASQTTESSASQTTDTTSSQSQTTADASASQTDETTSSQTSQTQTESSSSVEGEADDTSSSQASSTPTATTATPTATTATPIATEATPTPTTEAPSQSSNCKVKRRFRKL